MSSEGRASPRDRALVIVAGTAMVVTNLVLIGLWNEPWLWLLRLDLLRTTGWVACGALLLSLVVTPVARAAQATGHRKLPKMSTWMAYRRALGMVSAVFALIHAAISLGTYLRGSWQAVIHWPYLRSGLLALVVLTALLVTSFPSWVRALRLKYWKELHRLAYVAAALVLHHLMLSPFAPREIVLWLFAACLLGLPIRLLFARPRKQRAAGGDPRSTESQGLS